MERATHARSHRPSVLSLFLATVMPCNVTAVPLPRWCRTVPQHWQGCNWFVQLRSFFPHVATADGKTPKWANMSILHGWIIHSFLEWAVIHCNFDTSSVCFAVFFFSSPKWCRWYSLIQPCSPTLWLSQCCDAPVLHSIALFHLVFFPNSCLCLNMWAETNLHFQHHFLTCHPSINGL